MSSAQPSEFPARSVVFTVPEGTYLVSVYDPKTGLYSPGTKMTFDTDASLFLEAFIHDVVLKLEFYQ
jgi:hypothetical protein